MVTNIRKAYEKVLATAIYCGFTGDSLILKAIREMEESVIEYENGIEPVKEPKLNNEVNAYVVKPEDTDQDHLYWFDSGDDEFKAEAENQGNVMSLEEFSNCFNNNDRINQDGDLVRFL